MHSGLQMHFEDYAGAEATLTEALRLEPRHTGNLVNRGICRVNQDNYRGAVEDYNLALEIDSTNFIGRYNRGLLLANVGEDNKAIKDFDYILSIDPDDMMTLFNRARLLDQTGDYRAAIRDYTRVIEEFPKFLYGYQLRAEARKKVGDYKGAARDEEHILRENVAHYYGYSTTTSRMKNRPRKKSQIDPNDYSKPIVEEVEEQQYEDEYRGKIQNHTTDVRMLPVILLASDDDHVEGDFINQYQLKAYGIGKDAEEAFQKGIELCMKANDERLSTADDVDEKNAIAHNPQVATAIYLQAEEAFGKATQFAPKFPEAFYNRAYCLVMLGKDIEAHECLRKAIALNPMFARAYFNQGIVAYYLGSIDESMQLLSKAGELGVFNAYSVIKQIKAKATKNK